MLARLILEREFTLGPLEVALAGSVLLALVAGGLYLLIRRNR